MQVLQEFVAWFAKFVAVSITLLIAVYLYGRKQRLRAKRDAEQADQQKNASSGGMRPPRRS
jgi:ABC-type transport system involved in Fe-S cluster assembly fused permease/ATPase subunit